MKLKKPSRMQWLVIVAVAVVVALLLGNSDNAGEPQAAGPLDDPAKRTCDTFAEDYPKAKSRTARLALADRTLAASARTENDTIGRRAGELGRNADEDATWKTAAGTLIDACKGAGWTTA